MYLPFLVTTYSVIDLCIVLPRGLLWFVQLHWEEPTRSALSTHKTLLVMNTIRCTYIHMYVRLYVHVHIPTLAALSWHFGAKTKSQ